MIDPVRLFKPEGPDHYAVVSVEPSSWGGGRWMVRVARGAKQGMLSAGTTYGPFLEKELQERFNQALANLETEGFHPSSENPKLIAALADPGSAVRGRAALLLGWRRSKAAVGPLMKAAESAVDDVCSIIDALGFIGDPRAIPLARSHAERKLLSRRRSGVEALRNLGDSEGLALARQRALDRLPPDVVTLLGTLDEQDSSEANIEALIKAVIESTPKQRGLIVDTLYEAGTPATEAASRKVLASLPIGQPLIWRYTKSVLKRSMLRHDAVTFGWLSHAIEATARSYKGTSGTLRSGYDGKKRNTPVFKRKTVDYLRRATWRYLRRLAHWRPELYAQAAAEALIHFSPGDAQSPKGFAGAYADCYLLNQILWGKSTRLRFDSRRMRFKFKSHTVTTAPPGVREESYPDLWDAQPAAFLRLLAEGQLPEIQRFAIEGIKRHPEVVTSATPAMLLALVRSDSPEAVDLGLIELERRFGQEKPDFALIELLLADERKMVWELSYRWLETNRADWASDLDRVIGLVEKARGEAQARLTTLVIEEIPKLSGDLRRELAQRLLELLSDQSKPEAAHFGFAAVAREGLSGELDQMLSTQDLLLMVETGSNPAKTVAASLLGHRDDVLDTLGLEGVLGLAESVVAAVRGAAHQLLRSGVSWIKDDPSVLFALAESRWDDTRAAAFAIIREELGFEVLGLNGVIGLCDSTHPEVQEFGRAMVRQHFDALDTQEVLFRLVEHPSRRIQIYALELVREHLRGGFVPLARIEGFCRACLFDVWPDRKIKGPLIDFLTERALMDERQGELVAGILSDFVRSHTKADFERVADSLVRIQLAWPEVSADLRVVSSGGDQ
jgi:hypothetical protein